jgi:hypothetical protein
MGGEARREGLHGLDRSRGAVVCDGFEESLESRGSNSVVECHLAKRIRPSDPTGKS